MKQSGQSGNRRVLITGATGFIGANLIEKLIKDTDYRIYAFYNNLAPSKFFTLKPFRNNRIKPCQT
ncbi:MAG: NAD(P)-dependent oxidoreductase, partial [Candidatus Omnitrophica bacterium]|nr:NAD(P)-dependent oxidoreductase [Candidatus Omnitrophota bacterium]